jgi:hypothetical protein
VAVELGHVLAKLLHLSKADTAKVDDALAAFGGGRIGASPTTSLFRSVADAVASGASSHGGGGASRVSAMTPVDPRLSAAGDAASSSWGVLKQITGEWMQAYATPPVRREGSSDMPLLDADAQKHTGGAFDDMSEAGLSEPSTPTADRSAWPVRATPTRARPIAGARPAGTPAAPPPNGAVLAAAEGAAASDASPSTAVVAPSPSGVAVGIFTESDPQSARPETYHLPLALP